jgi:small subunit ribosomal protein S20
MANTKSAAKRARQVAHRTLRNRSVISRLRTLQKRAGSSDTKNVRQLISEIDKAAKRGIIHRNAASRRKARLNRLLAGAEKK